MNHLVPFPSFPPQPNWDFSACPQDERFTLLKYTCYLLARQKDPAFEPPDDWKRKYPRWNEIPYLQIPESVRRAAQRDLSNPGQVRAMDLIARSVPQEIFQALELLNSLGDRLILTENQKTFVLLEIGHGTSLPSLLEHLEALARECFGPRLLGVQPEGAGSYPRQFQADLNALSAYILLQTLSPEEATVITSELLGRALYSTTQKWREARDRGEFLIKKTLEGQLDAVLLSEAFERVISAMP